MNDLLCLAHVIDPFGIEEPVLSLADLQGSSHSISLAELGTVSQPILSYDVSVILSALRRRGARPPRQLVEIRDGLKLASGLSKDQGGERRWDAFRRLANAQPGIYAKKLSELTHGRSLQPQKGELVDILRKSSLALAVLWQDLRKSLIEQREWERFITVEVPVQQIFWHRQLNGIALRQDEWARLKQSVRHEKYVAFRALAQMLGMSPSSLTFNNIHSYLKGTDAEFLEGVDQASSLEMCFEIAQSRSQFARSFLAYAQARKDETTLVRVGVGNERMFPSIDCFGTVTGRITVSDPALQSLRRRHRGIVGADDGKVLFYCDFAQFEPGIAASIADDAGLIEAYNTHDLYRELSHQIFGHRSGRKEAKRVFLSYIYGMSAAGIARLLSGGEDDEMRARYEVQIESFFRKFEGLANLRLEVLDELQQLGRIESLMGNHRQRSESGRLTKKEQRWALSHRIQGTASLIFKEALRDIALKIGPDPIVLPMHDALLMQARAEDLDELRRETINIMEAAFSRWCPKMRGKIVTESFASNQEIGATL